MFERFTDRARKVLALANREAIRLNHEYIGTEHILLGILIESGCAAAKALAVFNIDLAKARAEVEALIKPGLDVVMVGKLPQTPAAKNVIHQAINEARGLGNSCVGTEHVLLGLLAVEGVARQVLVKQGADLGRVRDAVQEITLPAEVVASMKPDVPVAPVASEAPAASAIGAEGIWTGRYVSVALGDAMLDRIREAAKRREAETGKETSEVDVIRAVLEERFGKDGGSREK